MNPLDIVTLIAPVLGLLLALYLSRLYTDERFKQEKYPKLQLDGPLLRHVDESRGTQTRRRHRLDIGCRLLNTVEAQNIRAEVTLKLDRRHVYRATLVSDRFLSPTDPIRSFGEHTVYLEDLLRDWKELREQRLSSELGESKAWVFAGRPRPVHATLTWSWEAPLATRRRERDRSTLVVRPKTREAVVNGAAVRLLSGWELLSTSYPAHLARVARSFGACLVRLARRARITKE